MSGSYYTLNAKYNQLLALIQKYIAAPGSQDLASVLGIGDDALGLDITGLNNLDVVTINGSAYPPVVAASTLQQVLTAGNTASGAVATIGLTNSGAGYILNPQLILNNSNAGAGATTGVPSIELTKSGRNGAINDVVGSIFFNALDSAGVERTFGKIESSITTTTAPSNHDGALDFYSLINGVNNLVFRLNGADNENNSFRPLDLNGNALKTSTANLNIEATSSTGTGQIILTPKSSSNVNINGDLLMTTDKTITLNDISPIVVQTLLGNGAVSINDATNSNTALLVPSSLTFSTGAPSTTTYSTSGFFNNDNSIKCNSTDGFILNYASPTNFTQLDLSKLELYNSTPASNLIDQVVLQNTGAGNPSIGISSTDNTPGILTPILKTSGISNQSVGFNYIDTGAPPGVNTNLQLMNTTGGSGTLSYTNTIDASPLLITSNNSIQLQTSQDLVLGGASIQSNSASGNSGEHLRILLNGTYYKIKLEND